MRKKALCLENMSQDNITTIFILPFVFLSREKMEKKIRKGSLREKKNLPLSVVKNLCLCIDHFALTRVFCHSSANLTMCVLYGTY